MPVQTIHIFLNGPFHPPAIPIRFGADDFLIAVDGGLYPIQSLGLSPNLIIGDLDSIQPADLASAETAGAQVKRYPVEKDETDFELALNRALELQPIRTIIHAAIGGRMDQTLANLFLAGADRCQPLHLELWDGPDTYRFIHSRLEISGQPGDTVSLLPWEGPAEGVTTRDLRYPLRAETLFPDRSRGISNEMTSTTAEVSLTKGKLLCIHTRK